MVFIPTETGHWVSEEFCRLSEIVRDYDPALELRWIPPENRTRDDKKPYVIVDTRHSYPVLYASELDSPSEILATLYQGDAERNGAILPRLEAMEAAARTMQLKEWQDKLEEAADEAEFVMKSPLNTIRHNGKKLDDQRRVVGPAVERKVL